MSKVIDINRDRAAWLKSHAEMMRDVADLVEAGEINHCMVIYRYEGDMNVYSTFQDYWMAIGAAQFAAQEMATIF